MNLLEQARSVGYYLCNPHSKTRCFSKCVYAKKN